MKKHTKTLVVSTLALSLTCSAFAGMAAWKADAATAMETVISSDFENQSVGTWTSNGNCTQTVTSDAHGGDWALQSTLITGKTQNRIQTRISANDIKEKAWYEFSVYVKAEEATTMTGLVYFNANTAKELTVISGAQVGTEWTQFKFGYSYELTDNGCELSFRRPNMSSPANHTFTDITTSVTSFDLVFMSSVSTWYIDDFTVQTEKQSAEFQSAILATDFENNSVAPWTSGYSTLSICDDGYEGVNSMRVARNADSGQNRFQVNIGGSQFKQDVWTKLQFAVKASAESALEIIAYFNPTVGSPQYLYLSTGTQMTENWTEVEAGFSFTITDDTLNILFQRPNMSSPASHSVILEQGAQLKSMDFVFMSSGAPVMDVDNISISTPLTVSAEAGAVIDMIDALGTVTQESAADIAVAFAAYEALTDAQKAEVFNYEQLKTAQRQLLLLGGLMKGEFDEENVVFRFGAVSDTHNHNTERALQILSNWEGKKMDAFVMTGDITDRTEYDNNLREIPLVKTCFENNLPDYVDMFFCLGNHDSSAGSHAADFYDGLGERFYRSFLDKEYTRTTGNGHAVLGGYHFIAIEADYTTETIPAATMQYLKTTLESIVASPDYQGEYIFILSHVSPPNTVAAASPISTMTELISEYPQAVLLTGHSHSTLYSELAIMQTDFTTINLGSVSYTPFEGAKYLETADFNLLQKTEDLPGGSYDLSVGTMMEIDADGNVKITRIDFAKNAQIGEAWILPAPKADKSHLFAYPQERKTIFAEAPTWENPDIVAKTVSKNSVEITFDTATDDSYVHSYVLELYAEGASTPFYTAESLSGFYLYPQASDMPDSKTVTLTGLKQLPATVRITPKDSIGLTATPYTANVQKSTNEKVLPTSVLKIDTESFAYTLDAIYELSTSSDFATLIPNSGSISQYIGLSLYVREKETEVMYASQATEIVVETFTVQFPTSDDYTVYIGVEKPGYFINEVVEFSVSANNPSTHRVKVSVNGTDMVPDGDDIYSFVVNADMVVTITVEEIPTYTVVLSTAEGVTITNVTGQTTVAEGSVFQFKVEAKDGYDVSAMVVKANGKAIQAKNGVYSVTVTADVTITVEGVVKVSANEGKGCGSSIGISSWLTLLAACAVVTLKRKKI